MFLLLYQPRAQRFSTCSGYPVTHSIHVQYSTPSKSPCSRERPPCSWERAHKFWLCLGLNRPPVDKIQCTDMLATRLWGCMDKFTLMSYIVYPQGVRKIFQPSKNPSVVKTSVKCPLFRWLRLCHLHCNTLQCNPHSCIHLAIPWLH